MSIGAFEPLLAGKPYRRIYPDLPFMGESTDDIPGSGHDGMLAAVIDFIREVIPAGPFLLAGESYGGYLARGLARELAERVAGLFLLCPAVVKHGAGRDLPPAFVASEEGGWKEEARAAGATSEDLADYEALAVVRNEANFRRTRAEIISGIRVARLPAMERYCGGKVAFSFDTLGKAGTAGEPFDRTFDRPASFVLGRQDSSVGWRDALRLADLYPRASYHVIDGAGHNLQVERPEAFAAAFESWLRDCEEAER